MATRGKDLKNLWVDKDFLNWLKNLKAKKQLNGEEIGNLGDLTSEIMKTNAIHDVENQILKNSQTGDVTNIRIKLDAKRLFK